MSDGIDFPGYAREAVAGPIAFRRFHETRNAWEESEAPDADTALATLGCVTFNTWFQGGERKLRYAGLLEELRAAAAKGDAPPDPHPHGPQPAGRGVPDPR